MKRPGKRRIIVSAISLVACICLVCFVQRKLSRYGVMHIAFAPPAIDFYASPVDSSLLPASDAGPTRNVILFIGDGMGLGTIFLASMSRNDPSMRLNMERMPVVGLVRTQSANYLHTDSAAAATAMATGHKTNNDLLSILPDGTALKTILECARDENMRTGVIVTCSFADKTPAAFMIHGDSNDGEAAIAEKISTSLPNVLFGCPPREWRSAGKKDEDSFVASAMEQHYVIVRDRASLAEANGPLLVGIFEENRSGTPTLPELVEKSLSVLSVDPGEGKKGFLLVVEGSYIDKWAHANDTERVIQETLWMDLAIGKVLEFSQITPGTLVVVTADHDTGGISFPKIADIPYLSWGSRSHTAEPVPLFAYGAGAEIFSGVYDNTGIAHRIAYALGLQLSEVPANTKKK